MNEREEFCQITLPKEFSKLSRPRWLVLLQRVIVHIRSEGPVWTARFAFKYALRAARRKTVAQAMKSKPVRELTAEEKLDLQPGEWVEVKSLEEIAQTLDANGKNRGLSFLNEMQRFSGRRFPVYKRLNTVFLEETQHIRTMKNTVLLSGVTCDGMGYGCDRSCLFYWREAWLRRVDVPPLENVQRN
jgi:hypothetical protein